MKNIGWLVLVICLLIGQDAWAQKRGKRGYIRQNQELFPKPPQFKKSGWLLAPGATYMGTTFSTNNKTLAETETEKVEASFKPRGRPAFYFEAGRYHILQYSRLFKYYDYGIAYKGLAGKADFTSETIQQSDQSVISTLDGTNKFYDHYATAHFNLNHVFQLGDYNFIQNSIGIDANYGFSRSRTSESAELGGDEQVPGSIVGAVHYRIGYGIKASKKLMIIPTLETPLISAYPFDNGRSTLRFFNSRYQPIIFSLRFLMLRPYRLEDCVPIKNPQVPGGKVIPTDMEKTR